MDMNALSQEIEDPVFTCTMSTSGRLRNPKRDRADVDTVAAAISSTKKHKRPNPTMLVVAYTSIVDLADNDKAKYIVVVDKLLPVVDGVKVDVFNHDDTFYNVPSAPMGIEKVMDIKDYSFTVFTRNNKRRVEVSLYDGKQKYDCSVSPSIKPKGFLVKGQCSTGSTHLKSFVSVHKLSKEGEEIADYEPPMQRDMNPERWQFFKALAEQAMARHADMQDKGEECMDGVGEPQKTLEQDLHCVIL